jgi:YHS domain-containing protein
MKYLLIRRLLVLSVCLLLLGAAGAVGAAEAGTKDEKAEPRLALVGADPIEMIKGQNVTGKKEFSLVRRGFLYLFKNAENKATFEADPERWGIQGDGMCPVYPTEKADPSIAIVYKERIYAFATVPCIAVFMQEPEKYIAQIKKPA